MYNQAKDSFIDSFTFADNLDIISSIDRSYREYRSRAHTGNAVMSQSLGIFLSYPICQPEFLAANDTLDLPDSEDGKIIFDVIKAIDPYLLDLEFEFASPPWPERFTSGLTKTDTWDKYDGTNALAEYDRKTDRTLFEFGLPNQASYDVLTRNKLADNLPLLIDNIGLAGFETTYITKRLAHAYLQETPILKVLLAISETIQDIYNDSPFMTTRFAVIDNKGKLDVTYDLTALLSPPKISCISGNVVKNFQHEIEKQDLSHIHTSLFAEKDGTLTVNIQNRPDDVEVAIYWYLDGKREHITWYEPVDSVTWEVKTTYSHARAMIFLKRKTDSASKVVNVETDSQSK